MPLVHHGATLVIVGGGGSSPSPMGGGEPAATKALKPLIPIPKGFDPGDAQPGDKIDVTAHCKITADGKHLIVLGVDDDDDDDDSSNADADSGDDSESPGDRWNKAKFGSANS